jgi:hypothetical protein
VRNLFLFEGDGYLKFWASEALRCFINGLGTESSRTIWSVFSPGLINGIISTYNCALIFFLVFLIPNRFSPVTIAITVMNVRIIAAIIFNQYTTPITLEALQWKYYLIHTGWLVFELGYVYLYVVETRGAPPCGTNLADNSGRRPSDSKALVISKCLSM